MGSATKRSQEGRMEYVYFQTAKVPCPSGVKR